MSGRLTSLLNTLRPRTIARTAKSVEDLLTASRDLKRGVKQLEESRDRNDERTSALQAEVRSLKEAVGELRLRESRLRAIYVRDVEDEPAMRALDDVLRAESISASIGRSVDAAALEIEPFPHVVLERLFPAAFYDAVVRGLPPPELFDGPHNKQRIVVPFEMAPAYSRRVWNFLLERVIDEQLGPALIRKFRAPLSQWLRSTWPELGDRPIESVVSLQNTDGRILLRGRGYVIPPHRDPKWGFLTCLLYLPRPGDSESWGTQLYSVEGDGEAVNVLPHWLRAEKCRLVKDVPFRANSALVFLNSQGAHGANIPEDAEPPDLQRYIYQFRIGPTPDSIRRLVALLPEGRREMWSGKVADYA